MPTDERTRLASQGAPLATSRAKIAKLAVAFQRLCLKNVDMSPPAGPSQSPRHFFPTECMLRSLAIATLIS
jgi:hypothetical protein